MSGSPVVLGARADSAVTRLITALGALPAAGFERFVVVGGLAVFCRIGSAHRATNDLDTVIDNDNDIPVIAMLAHRGLERHPNGVFVDGTKVDVIEINPLDPHQLPDEPGPRLFVAAHRFTYDNAETATISIIDPDTATTIVTTEVALATPAGLVACKLHAYPHRRFDKARKQAGDALDLYALLDRHNTDGGVAETLRGAPYGLGSLCAAVAHDILVDNAGLTAARIRTNLGADVTADDLRAIGEMFTDGLLRT